jgi:hypothetical protein
MTTDISNRDDIIDVSDITDRVEELREERSALDLEVEEADDAHAAAARLAEWQQDQGIELATLESLLDELRGYGGNHQWEGDWYPGHLIRDSYFTEYCKELVEDIGDMPNGIPSYIVIDWDATADNLCVDYSSVGFDGETYWYR